MRGKQRRWQQDGAAWEVCEGVLPRVFSACCARVMLCFEGILGARVGACAFARGDGWLCCCATVRVLGANQGGRRSFVGSALLPWTCLCSLTPEVWLHVGSVLEMDLGKLGKVRWWWRGSNGDDMCSDSFHWYYGERIEPTRFCPVFPIKT